MLAVTFLGVIFVPVFYNVIAGFSAWYFPAKDEEISLCPLFVDTSIYEIYC